MALDLFFTTFVYLKADLRQLCSLLTMTTLSCRLVCLDICFKQGSVQRLPQGAQTTIHCHPSAKLTANRIANHQSDFMGVG